ncbi:MAG: GIY-YIG nuclease family protein [Elusimicrobiota bacterium]
MFFTYILYSRSTERYYIGSTDNLIRRFHEHSGDQEKATKGRGPWIMVYWASFSSHKEALAKERYLKSGAGYRWRIKHIEFPAPD